MSPRNNHIYENQTIPPQDSVESHPLENIDFDKIRQVLVKGLPWILLMFIMSLSLSYLYMRYTKPVYRSESILKLDLKNEAGILGLQNPIEKDIKGLSGEIEILKSRLFFSQVADAIKMNISYYHPGRSHLVDERYGNSPFIIDYEFISPKMYDSRIDLDIISDSEFRIDWGTQYSGQFSFGEAISNDFFEMTVKKTPHFENQKKLIDFYFVVNSRESIINYLQSKVSVEPINFNANTIRISFEDHNQYKARSMVQAIDTLYLAYTKNAKNKAGEQKIAFLEDQMSKTAKQLETYENYFEQFTIEHRTTDLSRDLSKTIGLLNQLDSQRFFIRNQLTSVEILSNQLANDQSLSIADMPSSLTKLISEYNELIQERTLKLDNYNENTQVIQRLDKQIAVAKDAARMAIQSHRKSLISTKESLSQRRKSLENNFEALPAMGTSYNKNRRLYNLQEEFYFSLIKSKIELEIAKAGTVTNFVILSPASFPSQPVHPKKFLTYGFGVIAGIFLSLVYVVISFLVHDKVSNQKELEKLITAPILGSIPKYMGERLESTRLVVNNNPKSSIGEALRSIRTNMDFIGTADKHKVISITSTISGEGKTFVAVNLGAVFAYSGKKVVIVDLDMRKPKVNLAFDSPKKDQGVSTILIGKNTLEECVQSSEVENLSYIQAGTTPPNPSELLMSEKFDALIEKLKSKFDTVILDTPPVGLVTDGILVMKKSQLPVYVVRAEYSRKSYAKSIQRLITNNRFTHLSVILNSVRIGNGYGYGYGYGENYYEDENPSPSGVKKLFSKA